MRHTVTRPILISMLFGAIAVVAGHQFTHLAFSSFSDLRIEIAESGFAIIFFLLLLFGFEAIRRNERKLQATGKKLSTLSEERSAVMQELADSRTCLAKAQRIAHLGNWNWNIQTGELSWSTEIYRIFGLSPQAFDATYEAFLTAVHPDDREAVAEAVTRAVHDKEPYAIEHRVLRPDGEVRYVSEQGEVVYSATGEPITMSGAVLDITERKRHEEKIQTLDAALEQTDPLKTAKQLIASEARYRTITDTTSEGYWLIDGEAAILEVNRALCQMLGYRQDEMIGRSVYDFIAAQDQDIFTRQFATKATEHQRSYRIGLTAKDQRRVVATFNATTLDETHNGNLLSFAFIHDVTEQRRLLEELTLAKEAAEGANRAKTNFLSNMSHELRTPMNAILGFSQLIQMDRKSLTKDQDGYLDIVVNSGNHLMTLINEILDLSRIEIGALKIELSKFDLGEMILGSTTQLSTMAVKHGVTFHLPKGISTLPQVAADPARLRQVLVNLLSNAIKYNRENGQVFVSVELNPSGMVRISVHDTGRGITTARRHELFQPFSRLDAENSGIEGSGVGLALSKNLVELMDGKIGYNGTEEQGSTFWIELPPAQAESHSHSKRPSPPHIPIQGKARKVLCIEDNPIDMRLLIEIADRIGDVEIIPAPSCERGLELAKTQPPDLVLIRVDQLCEGETSLQTWCNSASPPIPVVALCECQGTRNTNNCGLKSFSDCLDKPIDVEATLNVLRDILQQFEDVDETVVHFPKTAQNELS